MVAMAEAVNEGRSASLARRVARPTRIYVSWCAAVGVVTLGLALCLVTGVGGPTAARTTSNIGLSVGALAAAAACLWRRRQVAGRMRLCWLLIGAAAGSWGAGQLVWTWYESILGHEVPFPSLADVGYLGMPVLTAAGLLTLPMPARNTANRARSVLDGMMIAGSLLLMSWVFVLGPLIDAGADSTLALVISLAYPVSDVIVVTIVLFTVARGRQSHAVPMPLLLVGVGLVTFAVSDSGFAYLTMIGAYSSGAVIDIGWFAGFALVLLAAVKPGRPVVGPVAEPAVARSFGLLLPYVAVLAAVGTSVVELARTGNMNHFISWDRTVIIVLIVGRQVLTLMENRGLTRDLEARVARRTAELRASEQRFKALVQHSSDVVTVVNTDAVVIYQSESVNRIFGHDAEAMVGRPLTELLDARAAGQLHEALLSVTSKPYGTLTLELPIRRADERVCQAEITITNLLEDSSVGAFVLNTRDITEQKALENQLVHEAFHDALTNLANRALFKDRADQAIRRRDSSSSEVAVLFLDLDGFKEVNDSRGHAAGDDLLVKVADRLRDSVRTGDTVARFGGDEFAILVDSVEPDGEKAEAVATRLLAEINRPFVVENEELHVRASIGIAFAGVDADDADQLMRNADLAMYRAKAGGEGGYVTYDPGMHTALVDRLHLAADLRRGLDNDQFELYYQPTIVLDSGRITGFEALARWNHPARGQISPVEFIPLAEDTGFIRQLGEWVLRQACRQAAEWSAEWHTPLTISVNVSGHQLAQPDFLDLVCDALECSGLPAPQLCLEMTESVLMNDTEEVLALLNSLRAKGVRLAIDDFGTGYSSLSYLQRFPFDTLKIDRSFVNRLNGSSGETTLAHTIVQLGQGLGVTTVAEGLEHFEQFMALRRIGCDVGQGYYFSQPVPAAQAALLLERETGPIRRVGPKKPHSPTETEGIVA
jgi:diguanylate cyclase (GGDEF)-like protein/PAS domain S-box-containing protein